MKYYAVIDTNVVVSAMLKWNSVPGNVLELVFQGPVVPVLNEKILNEYAEVLSRPKFHFTKDIIQPVIITPKYRRKAIYGAMRAEIGKILRELCIRKEVEVIEAHAIPDHIHMLVNMPPCESVSAFMGYLKGKSTMLIFERYANLKYKYGNRHFWCRGYYVSTVGGNKQAVQKYIQNQEKEDMISDQISMTENYEPFENWLKSYQKNKKK